MRVRRVRTLIARDAERESVVRETIISKPALMLSEAEAAEFIGMSPAWLKKSRTKRFRHVTMRAVHSCRREASDLPPRGSPGLAGTPPGVCPAALCDWWTDATRFGGREHQPARVAGLHPDPTSSAMTVALLLA